MLRERPSDQRGWMYAVEPTIFVVVFEGIAWAVAAISGGDGPAVAAGCLLVAGAFAAVLMPIVIVTTGQRDAWTWAAVSVGLSSLGLFVGFIFYLGVITSGCEGNCFN